MAVVVDQLVYPAGRDDALTFRVYSDSGQAADPTVTMASAGTSAVETIYTGGAFAAHYSAGSTVSGLGTAPSPLVFTVRPVGGWAPTAVHIAVLRVTDNEAGGASDDPEYQIPPSLAAGKQVHYYPLVTDTDYNPAGTLVTIASVTNYNNVSVVRPDGNAVAYRGGSNFTKRGDPGTFDPLDFRHRRHLRLHTVPQGQNFATNLEADPALVTLWRDTYKVDIDLIANSTQIAVFGATVDRFRAMGFNINFGMVPVAARQSDPTDGPPVPGTSPQKYGVLTGTNPDTYATGLTSTWFNLAFWTQVAADFSALYEPNKAKLDGWYHGQWEAAFISQAIGTVCEPLGFTRAHLRTAMAPFLDVVRASGLRTLTRPANSTEDWSMQLLVEAGAPGSVWCFEGLNSGPHHRRVNEANWRKIVGEKHETFAAIARYMPVDSQRVNLELESTFRMGCAQTLEDPFAEYPLYAAHEVYEQIESNFQAPALGTEAWKQLTTRTAAVAGGTKQPQMNNLLACWTIADDNTATISASRCVGTGRGTTNQCGIEPWLRRSNGSTITVDAIDNPRPIGFDGFETPALVANAIQGWRVGSVTDGASVASDPATPSVAHDSITHVFTARLPTVAPSTGVMWGIWGIAAGNAHAVGLVWNGTTGALELNTRSAAGQDVTTYFASPVPGGTYRFVVAYDRDRDGSATGKWWTPQSGWVATSLAKNSTTVPIIIGGAHNMLNRGGEIWGIPGMVLPYDTDNMFWKRANWTAPEMTCLNTVTFTLTPTVTSSAVYSGKVDGVAWTYTSDSTATLAEVLAGIAAAIDAQTTATVTNTGTVVAVVRDGWLHVSRDDYRTLACARSVNRWPFSYNFD